MRLRAMAAALALCGSSALAQMQCDRGQLIDMAAEVIGKRHELSGFSGRHIGGDAAYFLLRYGGATADDLTEALSAGRPYRNADALFMTQRIAALGPAGTSLWGGDPRDILVSAFQPLHRAILLLDNGETYFNIVRQIEADPARAEEFRKTWPLGSNLHALLTDQTPDVLDQIARRAEADGHLVIAAALYAMMPEGTYEQFWERTRNSGFEPLILAAPLHMNANGTIALARDFAITDPDNPETFNQRLQRQRLLLIFKAGMAEAGTQTLMIGLNQSGREQEFAVVSEKFLAAVAKGEISPQRRPEEGWVFLLSTLNDVLGPQAVSLLDSFDQQADRRHYSGRALDVLQFATAVEAAAPWLRGDVAEAPEKPASLASSFDWPRALSVWSLVKAGGQFPDEALTGEVLSLALEGHVQRGALGAALDLAEQAGGLNARLTLARDIMFRQNRLCDRHGILPGQSVLLGGELLYDFQ